MRAALVAAVLALLSLPLAAHEVKVEQGTQTAAVVRLTYADGQPFAFEAYELYRPGQEAPHQVGRTNGAGQIVFLAGDQREWRLKAFTGDGHGVDQRLQIATSADPVATAGETSALPRWALLVAGGGLIFGLFGFVQLFVRKKS